METHTEDEDSLREILKKLLRVAVKCFYQPTELLLIDLLIRETAVSEKRFETVLGLDIKLIRSILEVLKNDHFLDQDTETEIKAGKRYRMDFYRIRYNELVDVIRYKLDYVQKRVETLERQSMAKTSFACSQCKTTWTDLEAGELFDLATKRFCCTICGGPVDGDSTQTSSQVRMLMAKFNVEVSPIYDVLKEFEDFVNHVK